MPRQTANGQSQDAPFVIHARASQPLAQRCVLLANALLEFSGDAASGRCPFSPQRPGGMQVEDGQAWIRTLRFACWKKATAIGEGQQVTHLSTLPAAIGHTLRQHLVEQIATGTGEQP
ncbi:hypothetical protein D3C72_2174430 [compost metagenome]